MLPRRRLLSDDPHVLRHQTRFTVARSATRGGFGRQKKWKKYCEERCGHLWCCEVPGESARCFDSAVWKLRPAGGLEAGGAKWEKADWGSAPIHSLTIARLVPIRVPSSGAPGQLFDEWAGRWCTALMVPELSTTLPGAQLNPFFMGQWLGQSHSWLLSKRNWGSAEGGKCEVFDAKVGIGAC